MKKRSLGIFLVSNSCIAGEGSAKELMIFPANGQSDEQMEKDKYACYSWAKEESVSKLNERLSNHLSWQQNDAQHIFPHYFEKH